MEREWRNNGGIGIGDHRIFESPSTPSSSSLKLFPISSPVPAQSSSSSCSSFSGGASVAVGGANYIEHPVSKFDTLAGVAIKYGVEVICQSIYPGLIMNIFV